MRSRPPSVQDMRTPTERALAEKRAGYFSGLMDQPDWGYRSQTAAHDPIYAREQRRMEEMIAGSAAARGFGALRHGPSVELAARGAQEMAEGRASEEASEMDRYRRWVSSAGQEASLPQGRYVREGRPSAFSQLLSPMLSTVGYGLGGPLGGAIAGWAGNAFGRLGDRNRGRQMGGYDSARWE